MKQPVAITDSIFWVGINDDETELFESIWPLPHGVSYNSYLIRDEKVALIDTVKKHFADGYLRKVRELLDGRPIDYLVVNHMEPDHSGAISQLRELYPRMQIVGNARTAGFLECFYRIGDGIKVVKDLETLNLGAHTLQFVLTPMVHWPETMMTYETSQKVLFSADAFGGFGALNSGIFDYEVDRAFFEEETRRYFSNIVGKYTAMVRKAIDRFRDYEIKIVASTHGPVYKKDPGYIISRYAAWSRYEAEKGVVVAYASMYGTTREAVDTLIRGLNAEGIQQVKVHNVAKSHISFIVNDIWRFNALVLATPTYNSGVFPLMDNLLRFLTNEGIKNRVVGFMVCQGWAGGALRELEAFSQACGLTVVEPKVHIACSLTDDVRESVRLLARRLAQQTQ